MSSSSPDRAEALSIALLRGDVDEALLRRVASLAREDVDPGLERTMLMTLADTADGKLRNLIALALAKAQSREAVPRLISLLSDPRTAGYRSSIVYALQNLGHSFSVYDLVRLILFNPPEVQEDALLMLQDGIERATDEDRAAAFELLLDSLRPETKTVIWNDDLAYDALEILRASFRSGAQTRPRAAV